MSDIGRIEPTEDEEDRAGSVNGFTFSETIAAACRESDRDTGHHPDIQPLVDFLGDARARKRLAESHWAMLRQYLLDQHGPAPEWLVRSPPRTITRLKALRGAHRLMWSAAAVLKRIRRGAYLSETERNALAEEAVRLVSLHCSLLTEFDRDRVVERFDRSRNKMDNAEVELLFPGSLELIRAFARAEFPTNSRP